jgi:hypothetical protein
MTIYFGSPCSSYPIISSGLRRSSSGRAALTRGTHALVALAQSLQDRLRQTFAREAGELPGEALDFRVADTERHDSIIYKLERYIQVEKPAWYMVTERRDNAGENPVRPICFVIGVA